ncbi:MAG: ATP-binding protein [Hyphomicrobiales bacterium]
MSLELPAASEAHQARDHTVIGEIVTVSGARATVLLERSIAPLCPNIGTFLTVNTGKTLVMCLITAMNVPQISDQNIATDIRMVDVELVGEIAREPGGELGPFRRGVSAYPKLGDQVQIATRAVLKKTYRFGEADAVEIGAIQQDLSIPATITVEEMLGKHFSVVGSTGTGKSCTVALILRQLLRTQSNTHFVLLDPHNEYGGCFGDAVELVSLGDLELPFWFLTFEELLEVLIGDVEKHPEQVDILRDLIPAAKRQFATDSGQGGAGGARRRNGMRGHYSVDTPVPYKMSDIIAGIDAQMGKLEMRKELGPYKQLKARLESVGRDPRYDFMFGNLTIQDNLAAVMRRLFRIPIDGRPISVIQLLGLPAEIINVVVSVLARLAFDLASRSRGKMPITFVCEEAHRYVPRDAGNVFEPTKRAISRIAKEGRKYGVSLCIVSQRPGDLDPTILSQCSTIFTMRLSNERDQEIIRSALSDASASLLDFLPSLGARETIVFGEGVSSPSRILLAELPESARPANGPAMFGPNAEPEQSDDGFVEQVVTSWRVMDTEAEPAVAGAETAQPNAAAQAAAAVQQQPIAAATAAPAASTGGGLIDRSKLSAAISRDDGMRASAGDAGTPGAALDKLAKRMRKLEG